MDLKIHSDKYELCWYGAIEPLKISFNYNPDQHLILSADKIKEKKEIINNFLKSGKKIEILPLYKLLSFSESANGLIFNLSYTDFGEYLLTDVIHPEWYHLYGDVFMSNPLSISALTITSDNLILLGRRSESVIDEPGKIQTIPGGFIHPPNSIDETTLHELSEELSIERDEIVEKIVIGLVRIRRSGKPEILLKIRVNLSSSEILSREAVDKWEFQKIETLENSKNSIEIFLSRFEDSLTPASHATLISYYLQTFGGI